MTAQQEQSREGGEAAGSLKAAAVAHVVATPLFSIVEATTTTTTAAAADGEDNATSSSPQMQEVDVDIERGLLRRNNGVESVPEPPSVDKDRTEALCSSFTGDARITKSDTISRTKRNDNHDKDIASSNNTISTTATAATTTTTAANTATTTTSNTSTTTTSRSKATPGTTSSRTTSAGDHNTATTAVLYLYRHLTHRRVLFSFLILLIGTCAATAFYAFGIVQETDEQNQHFQRQVTDLSKIVLDAWEDYQDVGLWIHESCHEKQSRANTTHVSYAGGICTRQDFSNLAEYIQSKGISFQSVQFMKNISHDQRPIWEAETMSYLQQYYPDIAANYTGLMGFEEAPDGELKLIPNPEQPFYFPVHYLEPVRGNVRAIDLNTFSHPIQNKVIQTAINTWKPALTGRIRLVQETTNYAYSIILYHPGAKLQQQQLQQQQLLLRPTSLCLVVIRIPALLERAASLAGGPPGRQVYLYDSTPLPTNYSDEEYIVYDPNTATQSTLHRPLQHVFLGAASLRPSRGEINGDYQHDHEADIDNTIIDNTSNTTTQNHEQMIPLPEIPFEELTQEHGKQYKYKATRTLKVANRQWTLVVLCVDESYKPQIVYVVLGGTVILVASVILAIVFYRTMGKVETEIAMETAKRNAQAERHLNEYIAHEVRNPLSSAIAALSFVAASVKMPQTPERQQSIESDIRVIDASLNYINDLLRNMLDMQRASSKIISITLSNVDIRRDVFEPVAAVLYLRGVDKIKVLIECPTDLIVRSDRLRLKQIVLNLAMNSTKFVEKGFIRLVALTTTDKVIIRLEDSGPGVPQEKRGQLFFKFQESLDMMSQGTGVGLCLCKHLSELLNGTIFLDEEYNSGVLGFPGSCFVLELNTRPVILDDSSFLPEKTPTLAMEQFSPALAEQSNTASKEFTLPESFRMLFVDDDMMIRKMFTRSIHRCCPGWTITEAANGETALHLVDSNTYDIIFVDQYMSSTEKQLLGSETVRALRARGLSSIIVGFSANDAWDLFREAGADAFLFKPFSCQEEAMTAELRRILLLSQRRI